MSPSLPTFIVLKSSHPDRRNRGQQIPFCVLHCTKRDLYKNIHLCNKDDIASPHAKFELVKADKGLYRIKCCYNNKLWSCGDSGFIQATEKEAVGSTLFKVEPVDTNKNTYRLMCMELQSYVRFDYSALYSEADWVLKVNASSARNDSHDVFTMINWESLVILPKDVAFKANDGHYVLPDRDRGRLYLLAKTSDIGDRRVEHQIITLSDQKIGIKNSFYNGFWTYDDSYRKRIGARYSFDYLVADSNDAGKPDSQFLPIKISNDCNLIALRNVDTDTLCYRDNDSNWFVLSVNKDRTIFDEAKVQVEELVLSRKVYDVDFRFEDTFIDSGSIIKNIFYHSTNNSDTDVREDLTLGYDEAISSSYDISASVKTISGFSFDVTMPIIKDGLYATPSVEFTQEEENKYSWGKSTERHFKFGVVLGVNVAPKTKVTAKMTVTKAKCNMSFSYTQRDLTTRGEHVVQFKDDGTYTCENCYIFDIKITEETVASS